MEALSDSLVGLNPDWHETLVCFFFLYFYCYYSPKSVALQLDIFFLVVA